MSEAKFAKAVRSFDIETMEILLKEEPDLVNSEVSSSSSSPSYSRECTSWLHWCFRKNSHDHGRYCECVELLVNHGADINERSINRIVYISPELHTLTGFTPVLFALNVKCLRCFRFLIEKGADLSITTYYVESILKYAIQVGAYAHAAILIQYFSPALINQKDKDGKTALMLATTNPKQAPSTLIQELIEAGADVNITDKDGNTALMLAIEKRAHEGVKNLIQHSTPGLLNHTIKDGMSALMFAIQCLEQDSSTLIQQLKKAGADVNITFKYGETARMLAIKQRSHESVKFLIQHSTPAFLNHTDKDGRTALMWVAARNIQEGSSLIQQLIEAGADPNIFDKDGKTALILAVDRGINTIVKALIQHSTLTLINHRDSYGMTALMWATQCPEQDSSTLIQQLIEAGADVNITDKDGKTALMLAVKERSHKSVTILIQHSTPMLINHRDRYGMTALMWATQCPEQDSSTLIQQLIEVGADVNITDKDGKTALMLAVKERSHESVKILIQHSTPMLINQSDRYGTTALMFAVEYCQPDACSIYQLLIEAGADLNIAHVDGNTTLLLALKRTKNIKFAESLIQLVTPALINHRDKDGRTALMWVILPSPDDINSAINCMSSEYRGGLEFVSLFKHLIDAGADVNLRDNDGETALSIALERGLKDIVHLLLEVGAIVNTISIYGLTPLYYALKIEIMEENNILNQFFKKNADPTFSRKHTIFIHFTIATNNATGLRMLVINGFPPQDCITNVFNARYKCHLLHSVSPLYLALWRDQPAMAHYLITNKFFTRSDFNRNSLRSKKLRQRLEGLRADECLQILTFHLQTVQTLSTLCLVTISSALTQDFREDNVGEEASCTEWRFTPTFKERVGSLGLPPKLQRALLHQTSSSRICCKEWKNISLKEERQFPDCDGCEFCG